MRSKGVKLIETWVLDICVSFRVLEECGKCNV